MPQLQDPNFNRSVILLVEHGSEGTLGLVLNRPVELNASELCASLDVRWRGHPETPIHWGGPVQPETGWVLFSDEADLAVDTSQVTSLSNGLHFAGSLEVLQAVAEQPPELVQFFLGYAGWGAGQLEDELTAGAWLIATGSVERVCGVPSEKMWEYVVRSLGVEPASLIPTQGVH